MAWQSSSILIWGSNAPIRRPVSVQRMIDETPYESKRYREQGKLTSTMITTSAPVQIARSSGLQ
jgi:hypothetical protein